MSNRRRDVLGAVHVVGLVIGAVVLGFAAAWAFIEISNAVLPPFREEVDDDTMREFVPVALAFLVSVGTTLLTLVLGLRWLLRRS